MTDTGTSTAKTKQRLEPHDLIISEVTKDDLMGIATGYYASFRQSWFTMIEPPHLKPSSPSPTPAQKYAARMQPWLSEPHTRWMKATLSPQCADFDPAEPNKIIGHAGWLMPGRTKNEILNFWRRDAGERLGWRGKMGWTEEEEEKLWEGVDVEMYQRMIEGLDGTRERLVGGVGHWFLAPLWVLPEFQGRGVAGALLRDGIALAEKNGAKDTIYLEAMPHARPMYLHFGFKGVAMSSEEMIMIRNPPEGVEMEITEELN